MRRGTRERPELQAISNLIDSFSETPHVCRQMPAQLRGRPQLQHLAGQLRRRVQGPCADRISGSAWRCKTSNTRYCQRLARLKSRTRPSCGHRAWILLPVSGLEEESWDDPPVPLGRSSSPKRAGILRCRRYVELDRDGLLFTASAPYDCCYQSHIDGFSALCGCCSSFFPCPSKHGGP